MACSPVEQSPPGEEEVGPVNQPPRAAVTDASVAVGSSVGDALTFRWSLRRAPPLSRFSLDAADEAAIEVTVDQPGTYVIDVTVSDGRRGVHHPLCAAGGFVEASLKLRIIETFVNQGEDVLDLHGDLYGLPFRTAAAVASEGAVLDTQFHADDEVEPAATLLVDDLLTSSAGNGVTLETDDAALLAYINGGITKGAVEGDFVTLRISPDTPAPIGPAVNYVVGATIKGVDSGSEPVLTLE